MAAISETIGEETDSGFVLNNPNIQTFEKKVKQSDPVESTV